MQEAKNVIINIVSWNSFAFLPGVLASLEGQDTTNFSVTVVDNASNDGTQQWLERNRPDVAMLRNFRNQGFARAHNQAIALALSRWANDDLTHRYIIVANPDLEFASDSVRLMTAFMDAHPEIDVCGPKLLRAFIKPSSDEERGETVHSNIIDSTGLIVTKARRFFDRGAGEEDHGQYDAATDVFGISGACVMFRASALAAARIGDEFFDERFFAYKEDVDVAWRMRRLGSAASYVPYAVVWHHRRAPSAPSSNWWTAWRSRQKKSADVNELSTRNHVWVMWKNDEAVNALIHAPWWFSYECAKTVAGLISWPSLKGQLSSLLGIPEMLKKRRVLALRVRVRGRAMRAWFV